MNWQMWLLVGLLLTIMAGLAGLAWLVWSQNRAIAILTAELVLVRDKVIKSEKTIMETLRAQGEHYQGVIEYLREQIALAARQRDASAEEASAARNELDHAQRESKKFAAILARKERRETR